MIVLITGQPGSGKTAHAVDLLANDPQFSNRPKFVMGVPDLAIEHEPCPPVDRWVEMRESPEDPTLSLPYFTFPTSAVVFIDEAQRVYRPRPNGSAVPSIVAAFETHRHTGVDFILVTQHANYLDANIRKLVGRHIHIRSTALGRMRYEWLELGNPESEASRKLAARSRYTLPSRVFKLYKSSEEHTKIKARIPGYMYVLGFAVFALAGFAYYGYKRVVTYGDKPETASSSKGVLPASSPPASSPPASSPSATKLTSAQYIDQQRPRIPGLAYTAPVYDEITKPIAAPYPAACYSMRSQGCRCYSQQATVLDVPEHVCNQIVKNGHYLAFLPTHQAKAESGSGERSDRAASATPPDRIAMR